MHQYIVVREPQNCPKLFETNIGWVEWPNPAVWLNSAILKYIKFQTGRSMSKQSLLSSK
jgi:hypothetical protein